MGCDYYVSKKVVVEYTVNDIDETGYLESSTDKCYMWENSFDDE